MWTALVQWCLGRMVSYEQWRAVALNDHARCRLASIGLMYHDQIDMMGY